MVTFQEVVQAEIERLRIAIDGIPLIMCPHIMCADCIRASEQRVQQVTYLSDQLCALENLLSTFDAKVQAIQMIKDAEVLQDVEG